MRRPAPAPSARSVGPRDHRFRPLAQRLRGALAGVLGAAVLAGVFLLYTRADFVVTMIDQVWACF
ncbi:MAG: hypothetical protein EOP72_02120 [Variovorax sp.]|jgi:hypothetical protein|nr:MAG: hypothetical protein EOP72_02120 [Variovorax sp.]